eukprot:CAMPEP_0198219980 /NCGR_PEP_ID=MMETSP1445-20131203/77048_1 /TAXON_ID=36898 /ORGANISM="Pyramimonas sp., Strain CCMP2087" /LENGTH=63 /DNA_ID=CAMNT_0043897583 /DNA_START=134 /DNA_END=322 /DNA_ORIENTATION=+
MGVFLGSDDDASDGGDAEQEAHHVLHKLRYKNVLEKAFLDKNISLRCPFSYPNEDGDFLCKGK